jgi:type IV fimbrial biogenesis protein FimT
MNRKGFSLVELIVVIAIIAILLTLATLNFRQWQRKSNIEREAKELYSDLMDIRQQAIVTGRVHSLRLVSAQSVIFLRYSTQGDTVGSQIRQRSLPYTITQSAWNNPSANEIDFNSRGMMDDPAVKTLCIYSDSGAAFDSIVILQSRISLGKLISQGGACNAANITIQ